MHFWQENNKEEVILISSKAIEELRQSFETIAKHYKAEFERLPSQGEIERIIQYSLTSDLEHFIDASRDQKIVASQLKLKKKTKKDYFLVGTLYAIPLEEHIGFCYGEIKLDTKAGLYIDYYDLYTEGIISLAEFTKLNPEVLVTILTGETSIISGEWIKVGQIINAPDAYIVPNFSGKVMERTYISYGAAAEPDRRKFVEESEAFKIRNPDGMFGCHVAAFHVEKLLFDKNFRLF